MKNRNIILTAILSLLVGLAFTVQAAPPPRATQDVNVVNTATNPVPVTGTVGVAENPARQAVQQELLPLLGTGSVTIPAGKIFVLETVSFVFSGSGTLNFLSLNVTNPLITGGQSSLSYFLVLPPPSAGSVQGSQELRLYAQPGTTLLVSAGFSGTGTQFRVHISGYFVAAQ